MLPICWGALWAKSATVMLSSRSSVFWRRLIVSVRWVIFLSEAQQQRSLVCATLSLWSGQKICPICNPTPGWISSPIFLDPMGSSILSRMSCSCGPFLHASRGWASGTRLSSWRPLRCSRWPLATRALKLILEWSPASWNKQDDVCPAGGLWWGTGVHGAHSSTPSWPPLQLVLDIQHGPNAPQFFVPQLKDSCKAWV